MPVSTTTFTASLAGGRKFSNKDVYGRLFSHDNAAIINVYNVSTNNNIELVITRRIIHDKSAFAVLPKVWERRHLNTNIKLKLFRNNVLAVLLYSSTWKSRQLLLRSSKSSLMPTSPLSSGHSDLTQSRPNTRDHVD